jgi:hypothetical protein
MSSFREFWGNEVPKGAGSVVEVPTDKDRLNVSQVRPAAAPLLSVRSRRPVAPCVLRSAGCFARAMRRCSASARPPPPGLSEPEPAARRLRSETRPRPASASPCS